MDKQNQPNPPKPRLKQENDDEMEPTEIEKKEFNDKPPKISVKGDALILYAGADRSEPHRLRIYAGGFRHE